VREANGQGLFIQGVVIDVTQQKHYEKALRESEQSYRAVFSSSTVLLIIHDGETLLLANQATAEILAYDDVTDLIGLPLKDFIHPEDQSFVMKIAKLRRQGAQVPSRYHMRIVDRQAGVHWVDSHSQTIEFAGNKVTLASAVDITEQKRFEQILRESEANYRAIVQDQTDIICRFTPDYTLTFVNDAYEQYFGLSANDLVGSKLWDLLPVESRAENRLHLTTIMSKLSPDNPVGLEENDIVVKGEIRSMQFTNRALFDYKAKLVGYQSVGRDVTERKKAEAELARYRDHLEELVKARTAQLQHEIQEHEQTQKSLRHSLAQLDAANKELEAFSYSVSHDLRAPLRALNNYSQFLQEDCAAILSEECLQYTEGIAESAQQMEKLVVDLLDYSRINRVEVSSADVDIAELIDELVVRLQLDQQATLHLPGRLPIIHAKRVRLEQIFINLLSNALKFRQKAIPLEITIAFEEREHEWLFSVQDNGIGIDARYQTKIFGIFQRLHTQEEYEGTGIGLAIVDKAVKEHNGQVVVESEPGKGSKFSFTIASKLS
jgi:PAS domain S-box-containing protein